MQKMKLILSATLFFLFPSLAYGCQSTLLDAAEAEKLGGSLNYSVLSQTQERVIAHANGARSGSIATVGQRIGCEFIAADLNKFTNTLLLSHVLDLRLDGVSQSIVDSISYGVAYYTHALIEGDRDDEAIEVAKLVLRLDEAGARYWRGYETAIGQLGASSTINISAIKTAIRNENIDGYNQTIDQAQRISQEVRSRNIDAIIQPNFNLFSLEYWFTALEDDADEAVRAIRRHGEIDQVFLSYQKSEEPRVRDAIVDRRPATLMQFSVWSLYELAEAQFEGREPSPNSAYTVICQFSTSDEFDVARMAKPGFQSGYESGQVSNDIKFVAEFISFDDRTLVLSCRNPIMD